MMVILLGLLLHKGCEWGAKNAIAKEDARENLTRTVNVNGGGESERSNSLHLTVMQFEVNNKQSPLAGVLLR